MARHDVFERLGTVFFYLKTKFGLKQI